MLTLRRTTAARITPTPSPGCALRPTPSPRSGQRDPPLQDLRPARARSARGCVGRSRSSPARTRRCGGRARSISAKPAVEPLRVPAAASKRISSALISRRRRRHAEAPQVLGREVHPAAVVVLAHVAQDVGQLHRHAEVVGQRRVPVRARRRGEDRQAQAADRAGHVAGSRRRARRRSRTGCRARRARRRRSAGSSASSGRSKRARACASATATGSTHRALSARSPPARCRRSRPDRRARRQARRAWRRCSASPSPMSSTRRANAYTALIAWRLSRGSSRMP